MAATTSPGRGIGVLRNETRTRAGRASGARPAKLSTRITSRAPTSRSSRASTVPTSGPIVVRVRIGAATCETRQVAAAKPRSAAATASAAARAAGRAPRTGTGASARAAAIRGAARLGAPSAAAK